MVSLTNAPADSKRWLKFGHDWRGRRVGKTVCLWTNSAWSVVVSNKFLYDGWNLIAELNATNNAVIRSYAWGLDLSGSEQGAGGVGGLVAAKPVGAGVQWPAYDGNANVMGMYDAAPTNWVARFEYGPFGEAIRATPRAVTASPFRFSTKYCEPETEMSYYGYRFYVPGTGRWVSRDPIGHRGGQNYYGFVANSPAIAVDSDGRFSLTEHITEELRSLEPPYLGKTHFEDRQKIPGFDPKPAVYSKAPPCFRICVGGTAYLRAWWVKDGRDGNIDARTHELVHVRYHQSCFFRYKEDAESYDECYSREKAECLAGLLRRELRDFHLAANHLANIRFDCERTGDRCDEKPMAETYLESTEIQLRRAKAICEARPD